VLALVAEDLTNAEIGIRLLISPKAVDQHVSAILGKIGADNRTEAARWYRQHGAGDLAKSL
jgi:DNA-binding CsgD family transcriptional regulator